MYQIKQSGLELNESKRHFHKPSIKFVSHVFSGEGISVYPDKVTAIDSLILLEDKTSLRKVLGGINYLQRYTLAFITVPLYDLSKDHVV